MFKLIEFIKLSDQKNKPANQNIKILINGFK